MKEASGSLRQKRAMNMLRALGCAIDVIAKAYKLWLMLIKS